MKRSVFALFIFLSGTSFGDDQKIVGDINCNGKSDSAKIIKSASATTLQVILNDGTKANELSFGLGQPNRKNALCGVSPTFKKEKLSDDLSDSLGQNPPGY